MSNPLTRRLAPNEPVIFVSRQGTMTAYPGADASIFWAKPLGSAVKPTHDAEKIGRGSQAGFTLVEVVVALAILALSLAVLLGVMANGMRQAEGARKLAQAGSLAQSLLAGLGAETPIHEGVTAGEFAQGFRWRVRAEPYGGMADRASSPVAAFVVSVDVLWGQPPDERSVTLTTLRLAPKEPAR